MSIFTNNLYALKTIILLALVFSPPIILANCPIGMHSDNYGFGNEVCTLSGKVRTIKGSLQSCPKGFYINSDQWSTKVCFDGVIRAYNLTNGCPKNLIESWDSFGRSVCINNGQIVTELVG